ncbi:hypothetical protein AM1_I0001 (plasmid) [Acaryochloris marina MBIC11017]|uniref:Uncharacterized protein n=1 Tax=Acaryochloris marina (strain MBIC 11017) TaxID=329726 RepID=A8ZR35_ACAM1|nr:hypothetical protein AM1_I0001 [Acaryochloris marina MBIC11017]
MHGCIFFTSNFSIKKLSLKQLFFGTLVKSLFTPVAETLIFNSFLKVVRIAAFSNQFYAAIRILFQSCQIQETSSSNQALVC